MITPRIAQGCFLLISAAVIAGCARGVDAQSLLDASKIKEPNDYPWCSWSGEVKAGKPQGWGVGSCLYAREPAEKGDLSPPLTAHRSQVPSTEPARDVYEKRCSENLLRCKCEFEADVARSGRIDDYITFRGHYANGRREGEGVFFSNTGEIFIGEWRDDRRHGTGSLFSASCDLIYTGEWCHDRQGGCKSVQRIDALSEARSKKRLSI